MHQAGLLNYATLKVKQGNGRNACIIESGKKGQSESNPAPFKLGDFSGAFIVLGFGIFSAFVIYVLEVIAIKIC